MCARAFVGRSYSVFSQRTLNQCLESLVQKIQSGVVINFEKTGPDPIEGKKVLSRNYFGSHCSVIYFLFNINSFLPSGCFPIISIPVVILFGQ